MNSYPLWPSRFIHSGAIGNSPLIFPSNILYTFRDGGFIFWCHIFLALYNSWQSYGKYTGVVCFPSSSGSCFVRALPWPISIGWPCTAWLRASLNQTSPFTMTRQWSMKGFCSQYVGKSGRPSSGHRTGKGRSSSQSPRRVELNNVLTIRKLHSSPGLVRSCLKSCMLGFSVMWTKNFQISKLGLEKEEKLEIKLPTFAGLQRKQGSFRKTSISSHRLC